MATSPASVGSLIRAARDAAGMSQQDLGQAVGVTQQQVGKWERDENTPSAHRIRLLAEALGLAADELLPRADEATSRRAVGRRTTAGAPEDRVSALEARVAELEAQLGPGVDDLGLAARRTKAPAGGGDLRTAPRRSRPSPG